MSTSRNSELLTVDDKDIANGVAGLDGTGKIPLGSLPAGVAGGLTWKGTWDANTNTPALASATGTNGDTYRVSVAGATNLDGITDWKIGDWAMYNGTAWEKMDNTDEVASVAGKTGTVTLDTGDVTEVTDKKYVTDAEKTVIGNTSGTNSGDEVSATESVEGIAEIATQPETHTGTDNTRFITPLKLAAEKGIADGIASLDGSGFLLTSQIPQTKRAQVKQDSANWVGNGQKIRTGASWIDFASEDFDTDTIHDNTVYVSGTATGTQSATTLQDTSKSWTVDEWAGYTVKLTGGTGADEVVKILSNTADTLTVDTTWIVTPVSASTTYEITKRGRFLIPETGLYAIAPRLTFAASSGTIFGTYIYKNNVFFNSVFFSLAAAIETTVPFPTEFMELTTGDYIEIKGYSGTAGKNLLAFGSRVRCSIFKIGN